MTQDERNAAIDALNAILQSHQPRLGGGGSGGSMDMPVDPNLLQPKHGKAPQNMPNVKVNDPNHVLDKLKQNQNQQGQSNSGQGQGQSTESSDKQNNQESQSGEGQQDKEQPEKQGESEKSPAEKSNEQGNESQAGENGDDKKEADPGKEQQGESEDKGSEKIDADYTAAWNDILARFDNDNVSEAELRDLIDKINSGAANI